MNTDLQIFDNSKIEILKNMYFKGASNDELSIFLHACKRTQLDPFMRQIYCVMRWDSKANKNLMTIQTGIDGYRLIAERTGRYAPGREPTYIYQDGKIISCTAYVKKQTQDGTWHEIAATAFYDEYVQRQKDGKPTRFWLQMGHNQIAKCAEALALRKAFPGDLSGVYTKEEMEQAEPETIQAELESVKEQLQIDNQNKEKVEFDLVTQFITQYPEENSDRIWLFFSVMKDAWKKDIMHVLNVYRDHEKFTDHFTRWKSKYPEKV